MDIDYKLDTKLEQLRYYKRIRSEMECKRLANKRAAGFLTEELDKLNKVIKQLEDEIKQETQG